MYSFHDRDTVDQELSIVMWSLSSNFMMVYVLLCDIYALPLISVAGEQLHWCSTLSHISV
jgi:hypothetical protein